MRLWPLAILDQLPRQQLLGQHRECCALRGKGWGRKHATVDYVFKHPHSWLFGYHVRVMNEMSRRGFTHEVLWSCVSYRGKTLGFDKSLITDYSKNERYLMVGNGRIFPEHDESYLGECIANLAAKGIAIDREKALGNMKIMKE